MHNILLPPTLRDSAFPVKQTGTISSITTSTYTGLTEAEQSHFFLINQGIGERSGSTALDRAVMMRRTKTRRVDHPRINEPRKTCNGAAADAGRLLGLDRREGKPAWERSVFPGLSDARISRPADGQDEQMSTGYQCAEACLKGKQMRPQRIQGRKHGKRHAMTEHEDGTGL